MIQWTEAASFVQVLHHLSYNPILQDFQQRLHMGKSG